MGISIGGSIYTSEVRRRLRNIGFVPSAELANDVRGLVNIQVRALVTHHLSSRR